MRPLYQQVLYVQQSFIEKNIYISDEFFHTLALYQNNTSCSVFSKEEIKLIKKQKDNEKISCLLRILKTKEDRHYGAFKQALSLTKHGHVLKLLNESEGELQPEVERYTEETKRVLIANFKEDVNGSVVFNDIFHLMIGHYRTDHDEKWLDSILDKEFLANVIGQVFKNVLIKEQERNTTTKCSKKHVKSSRVKIVKGISNSNSSGKPVSLENDGDVSSEMNSDDEETCEKEFVTSFDPSSITIDDLAIWLEEVLSKHDSDTDQSVVAKFKAERIDGHVFNDMLEDELKEFLPLFGERKKVLSEWQKIKEGYSSGTRKDKDDTLPKCQTTTENGNVQVCHFRKFDRDSSSTFFKYLKNAKLPDSIRRPGNLLSPFHHYFLIEEGSVNTFRNTSLISKEIIKFGCACLNERMNGTIHIGVSSNGIIQGTYLSQENKDLLETKITDCIMTSFPCHQHSTALSCIRPPQFVEVLCASSETMYVIEVDVVPCSRIVNEQAFFVKSTASGGQLNNLFRYNNGICIADSFNVEQFLQSDKFALQEKRKEAEKHKGKGKRTNLNKKLKDFLCNGGDKIDRSKFPLLALGSIVEESFKEANFIAHVPWNAIFDFNARDEINSIQVFLENEHNLAFYTNSVNDFDDCKTETTLLRQTFDNLRDSSIPNWIYCNELKKEDPSVWRFDQGDSFRKSLEFYSEKTQKDKSRVIITLFNDQNEVLTEGAAEIFLKFRNQCLVICSNESIADLFRSTLQKRNAFPPNCNIDDMFLVGLPWSQINECVNKITDNIKTVQGVELPRSSGVPCALHQKLKNELSELEILGCNHCTDIQYLPEKKRIEMERQVAEDYYRGGMVSWPNFHFSKQVLERDIHPDLNATVVAALEGLTDDNDDSIKRVTIYHQPGSGGSTTARQMLWNSRMMYRCCVVKNITKQTSEQICRLHNYEENHEEANPVLLLIDTFDEKLVKQLYDDLGSESRKYNCDVFCVLLICMRVSELPLEKPKNYAMLQQYLSNKEHDWFKKKYKNLLDKHKKKSGCDPKTLLAFNIMKVNFDKRAIENSVLEFVRDESTNVDQRTMLKYLAFINAYDLSFELVPVVCFDPIMETKGQWVNRLSHAMKILITSEKRRGIGGTFPAVRISNYLLAKPVLAAVIEYERDASSGHAYVIGEIAASFLKSKCFSKTHRESVPYKMLLQIVGNIMKKRDYYKGKSKTFSPLIMEVYEQKDLELCIELFHTAYDITHDIGVTHQLARFYGEQGNWKQAHSAIDEAIIVYEKRDNPFFLHTKGYLFQSEFHALIANKKYSELSIDDANDAVNLVQKALSFFRKVQTLSGTETTLPPSSTGYESEIRIIIDLFKVLKEVQGIGSISNLLFGMPSELQVPIKLESIEYLQELPVCFDAAVESMEKEVYAMNKHPLNYSKGYTMSKEQLEKFKRQFYSFLSDSSSSLQSTLPRRLLHIFSLPGALSSNININNEDIKHQESKRFDFNQRQRRQFLIASLKLLSSSKQCTVRPDVLLDESRRLFEKQARDCPAITSTLDEHLIFVAIHWPLKVKESLKDRICPSSVLYKSLQSWDELVKELPYTARRMDKILLYISKSGNFPFLVKADNVDKNDCLLFKGKVLLNGTKVEVSLQGFNIDVGAKVEIRFYQRVRRALSWNRDVNVVIGFGQHGPRAELAENGSLLRRINMPTSTNENKGKPNSCHNDLHDTTFKKGLTDTSNFINHAPNMVYKTDILDKDDNLKGSSIPKLIQTSHFLVSDNCDMSRSNKFPIFQDTGVFSDEKKNETSEKKCDINYQCAEYHEKKQNVCGSRIVHASVKDKKAAENLVLPKPKYTKDLPTNKDLRENQLPMSTATVSKSSEHENLKTKFVPAESAASEKVDEVVLKPKWQTNFFSSTKMSIEGSILHHSSFTRSKTSTEKTPTEKPLLALKDYLPLKMWDNTK